MVELLPFAEPALIPAGPNDPRIHGIGNIFHIAVSEARSLHDFFNGPSGGIESHGYIRRDGSVEQYRGLEHEADANSAGNSFFRNGRLCGFWSWETQGMGEGEWTPEQLATIQRIIRWTHDHKSVPLRVCRTPVDPGNGYHALFDAWNPNAHACPGRDRIRQFNHQLAPWMRAGAHLEDDMKPEDFEKIREIVRDEVAAELQKEQVNGRNLRANVVAIARKVGVKPKED